MTSSATDLALALQVADSAFPSGAFSASWGIEGMHASGLIVDAATLESIVRQQVEHRWATSDRWFVAHGFSATVDIARLRELDQLCEITMVAPVARATSRRGGLAMVSAHGSIGVTGTGDSANRFSELKSMIESGKTHGHLPVMHGMVLATIGLPLETAIVTSGMQFVQALCSAALRLGVVGHLDAQRVVSVGRRLVVAGCAMPLEDWPSANVPDADIAMLAHPHSDHRLFSC